MAEGGKKNKRSLFTRLQSVPADMGRAQRSMEFDKELEKVFHPEKFDVSRFATSELQVDEGQRFYRAHSHAAELDAHGHTTDEEAELPSDDVRPDFMRSASVVGTPTTGHSNEFYVHYHPIMTRIKPKPIKKADSHKDFSQYGREKAELKTKGRKPTSGFATTLTTIAEPDAAKSPEKEESLPDIAHLQSEKPTSGKSLEPPPVEFQLSRRSDTDLDKDESDSDEGAVIQKKPAKSAAFSIGHESEEEGHAGERRVSFGGKLAEQAELEEQVQEARRKKKKHHRHRHGHGSRNGSELSLRRRIGSELAMSDSDYPLTQSEEAAYLQMRDVEEMASHRNDYMRAMSRHKIDKMMESSGVSLINLNNKEIPSEDDEKFWGVMDKLYGEDKEAKQFDHSPHDLFVEMDELEGDEWVEQARWIKYEEDRLKGAERWGRPHVAPLSFHSLINVRLVLEQSVLLLDFEANNLVGVVYRVVEEFGINGDLEDDQKGEVLRVLLYKHKYVEDRQHGFGMSRRGTFIPGIKKSLSGKSLTELNGDAPVTIEESQSHPQVPELSSKQRTRKNNLYTRFRFDPEFRAQLENLINHDANGNPEMKSVGSSGDMNKKASAPSGFVMDIEHQAGDAHSPSPSPSLSRVNSDPAEMYAHAIKQKESILRRVKAGTEGTIVLVGQLETLTKPISAFVRLAEGIIMPNAMEVPLPVRFIFVLLTPKPCYDMDYHEIGRSFSTLMSNPKFHTICYQVEERRELLNGINSFLDESVVLPPGDWESRNLLSVSEINEMRKRKRQRMAEMESELTTVVEGTEKGDQDDKDEKERDEKKDDVKVDDKVTKTDPLQRGPYPFFGVWNDWRTRFPVYLSDIKDGLNAQVLAATIFIYFAALSGAIAFGGLLGEKTKGQIGIPETLIVSCISSVIFSLFSCCPLIIVGVTGPLLIFDEALFSFVKSNEIEFLPWRTWIGVWVFIIALVNACFQGSTLVKFFTRFTKDIFSALISLAFIYEAVVKLVKIFGKHPIVSLEVYCNATDDGQFFPNGTVNPNKTVQQSPNTALLSFILMFGTFFIAYFLRIFRNSNYLGRTARRGLADFGVPIAIVIAVGVDYAFKDSVTQKLDVPTGLQVTSPSERDWFINPMGIKDTLPVWAPFAAVIPAFLLFVLLFMETHICELLMRDKTQAKGVGLHWDIVLVCLMNFGSSFFGGPWICAATVRAVAHVSALTVMSTNHAPGESPYIVEVKDQRLSHFIVGLLVGLSVLLSEALKLVPFAVLFGVFLYMGFTSMNGNQFLDRIWLLLMPIKHYPRVSYTRKVRTWKMHLYTGLQFTGLAILWAVKSSPAALAFPFFVLGMVPYRMVLKFIFNNKELEALDGPKSGQMVKDDEPDFYEEGIGG